MLRTKTNRRSTTQPDVELLRRYALRTLHAFENKLREARLDYEWSANPVFAWIASERKLLNNPIRVDPTNGAMAPSDVRVRNRGNKVVFRRVKKQV